MDNPPIDQAPAMYLNDLVAVLQRCRRNCSLQEMVTTNGCSTHVNYLSVILSEKQGLTALEVFNASAL